MRSREAHTLRPAAYDPNAFGPYRLVSSLGKGAMGSVYSARRAGSRELVALKLLHEHLEADARAVAAFEAEAQIASRVRHPAVCRVNAHGVIDGRHYLESELCEGVTLVRLLEVPAREQPHFGAILARLLAELCRGLHAAHEATAEDGSPLGLVHRDVSPHNLYLLFDGSVRVIDFGIARSRLASRATTPGIVKGRLAYVAPEHLLQAPFDRRADVWSMGVVAWELVTGERLFRRESLAACVDAVLRSEIPPVSVRAVWATPLFEQVIARALSRPASARHASMAELADDFERVAEGLGGAGRRELGALARSSK